MSSFALRILALVTMFVDHIGFALFPFDTAFRIIGRISFPIFCFLVAQGFAHTRNIKKYFFRLALFAFLSEIPYDLVFSGKVFSYNGQNVFFTLTLALLGLICYRALWPSRRWAAVLCILGVCALAVLLDGDYSFWGVLLVLNFYVFRRHTARFCMGFIVLLALYLGYHRLSGVAWSWSRIQLFSAFALIPLALYNGKPGHRGGRMLFYIAYPAHLCLLYAINRAHLISPFFFRNLFR